MNNAMLLNTPSLAMGQAFCKGEQMIEFAVVALAVMQSEPTDVSRYLGEHEWCCIDVSEKVQVDEDNPKKPPKVVTTVSRRQICFQHGVTNRSAGTVWLFFDDYVLEDEKAGSASRRPIAWTGNYSASSTADTVGHLNIRVAVKIRNKFVGTANGKKWKWEFDPALKDREVTLGIPIGEPKLPLDEVDMLVAGGRELNGRSWERLETPNDAFAKHFVNIGDTLRLKRGSMLRRFVGKSLPPGFKWNDKETVLPDAEIEAMLKDALEK